MQDIQGKMSHAFSLCSMLVLDKRQSDCITYNVEHVAVDLVRRYTAVMLQNLTKRLRNYFELWLVPIHITTS